MLIFVIPRTKNQSITVKGNNIALGFATASTQEGNSVNFETSSVLQCLRFAPILRSTDLAKANLDSSAWPGGVINRVCQGCYRSFFSN
jgi:hypothetical protein